MTSKHSLLYNTMTHHEHPSHNSPQKAARNASRWNYGMGAAQTGISIVTGNVGFAVEATHNMADGASFGAKASAMEEGITPEKARRKRNIAATILATTAFTGIGLGANQIVFDGKEDATVVALSLAVSGAAINTAIARRTHAAHHDHHHDGAPHGHAHDAHSDSKLHTLTDAGTGWLYVIGLTLEHKLPGAANYAVLVNGGLTGASAAATFRQIRKSDRVKTLEAHKEHSHE